MKWTPAAAFRVWPGFFISTCSIVIKILKYFDTILQNNKANWIHVQKMSKLRVFNVMGMKLQTFKYTKTQFQECVIQVKGCMFGLLN